MFRPTVIFILAACLFHLLCLRSPAHAENLQDLVDSPVLKDMGARIKKDQINLDYYSESLPKEKEYSRVFVEPDGRKLLNYWIGSENPKFPLAFKHSFFETDRVVISQLKYIVGEGRNVVAEIILPNPNFRSLAEFDLLEEITDLKPPKLKVVERKKVELAGHSADFFKTPDQRCFYLFPLSQQAVLNVEAKCSLQKEMESVIEAFDIHRLNQKLNQ